MDAKTILIADDETHILNVLTIKLQNAGYNVVTAEDGAEAYAAATRQRPDLVITDYQMPRLSGLELCSKLEGDPATRDVPAILLTARGFSIPDKGDGPGNIREVITKPFSPREVLVRVRELLAESAVEGSTCSDQGKVARPAASARRADPGGVPVSTR